MNMDFKKEGSLLQLNGLMKTKEEMENIYKDNLMAGTFVCHGVSCIECPFYGRDNSSGEKCGRFPFGKTPTNISELKPLT